MDWNEVAISQSKELEILVANIQKDLAPDAEVTHDAKIIGRHTNVPRQIDVLVRQKVGQYEMIIAIDCKDYKIPVDVKGVEEFHGLVDDVGAHKGALVCPKGFSKAAKERALGYQIELYSPLDKDPHKWQVKPTVPALCDFREARIGFGLKHCEPLPMTMPWTFYSSLMVFDRDQNPIDTPLKAALKKWDEGRFPIEPGIHEEMAIFEVEHTLVDNGYGKLTKVILTANLLVSRNLYFGEMPISKVRGFKNELTGALIANAFTLGMVDPNEVETKWQKVNEGEELPVEPLVNMIGLIGYEGEN